MQTGSVRIHAMKMFRKVAIWRPDLFAAMVPATPEDRTCVVLTGSPKWSAARIVHIATNSADPPCA